MDFAFKVNKATAVAILKRWNIVLMESIAASSGDPEQMNYIGKVLNKHVSDIPEGRLSKSFRKRSQSIKEQRGGLERKRSGSFSSSRSTTLRLPSSGQPFQLSLSGSNSPNTLSQSSSIMSGPKFLGEVGEAGRPSRMQTSPPPLPPRPVLDCSSSDEDPDYAYIEESKVEGPSSAHSPSREQPGGKAVERTLDEKLEDIARSMKREKKEKRRKEAKEKQKAATVAVRPTQHRLPFSLVPKMPFAAADPEDYLEPLSASLQTSSSRPRSTGDYETPVHIHNRSISEPDNSLYRDAKSLSQPSVHLLRNSPPRLSPTPEHGGPPALPSRYWRSKGNGSNFSGRNSDDPDISPYAVVRQILPGRIMEEPDMGSRNIALSNSPMKQSPTSQEQHQLGTEPSQVSEQSAAEPVSSPTATTPPTALPSNPAPDTASSPRHAPPLPPRSPIKEKLSWNSSSSSVASNHSHKSGHSHPPGTRCSKCQRHRRAPVEKTLSEHRPKQVAHTPPSSQALLEKGSLPDLNSTAGIPENSLRQRRQRSQRGRLASNTESRSSSEGSSTSSLHSQSNSSYLEIVPDANSSTHSVTNKHESATGILDDFLQYFDDKVSSLNQPDASPEVQKNSHPQRTSPHNHTHNHTHTPVHGSHPMQYPTHSSSSLANGHLPTRRVNGPTLQRSQTAASFSHNSSHQLSTNKSLPLINPRAPAPPVPPRSDVSLGGSLGRPAHYPANHHPTSIYHARPSWSRTGSSGSFGSTSGDSRSPPAIYGSGNRTRQSSSSSIHSGSPSPTTGPGPHPRSLQHLARHFTNVPESEGSSTVFIHHLKHDRRVMHSHMV